MPLTIVQKRNVARFLELQRGNYIFPPKQETIIQFDVEFQPRNIQNDLTLAQKAELKKADNTKRKQIERAGGRRNVLIETQPRGQIIRNTNLLNPLLNMGNVFDHEPRRRIVVEPVNIIRRIRQPQPLSIVNSEGRKVSIVQAYELNFVGCRLVVNNMNQTIQMLRKITAYAKEMYKQNRINKRFRLFFRNMEIQNSPPFASSALVYCSNSTEKIRDTIQKLQNIQERWIEKIQNEDNHYGGDEFDANVFFSNVMISMEPIIGGCGNRHKGRKNTEFLHTVYGDMKVFSPPSRDNNCGLELLRMVNSSIPSVNILRKQLNIPSNAKTSAEQLHTLFQAYSVEVKFLDIQGYDLISKEMTNFENLPIYTLIFDQEHWFHFKGFENMKVCIRCKKSYREKHTCNEKMVQYQRVRDLKGDNWVKMDLETRNSLKEGSRVKNKENNTISQYYRQVATKCALTQSMDFNDTHPKTDSYLGLDCVKWCIDTLLANNHLNYIHSHNGSRFDMFFFLNELQQRQDFDIKQCLIKGSKILSIRYQNLVFLDTMNCMAGSLDKLCVDFKVKQKKIKSCTVRGVQYDSMELCLLKPELDADEFIAWLVENPDFRHEYKTYCEFDTKSLFELHGIFCLQMSTLKTKVEDLVRNFKYKMKALSKCDIRSATTLSGYSDKLFHALYMEQAPDNKSSVCTLYQPEGDEAKFLEKLTCGGISSVSKPGIHYNFTCVDIVSMYVAEMINRQYPVGKPIQTEVYIFGKLGGYRCTEIHQATDHIMDFPLQTKKGLDWHAKYIPEAFLTSVDIERMLSHGSTMNIHEGYYWEEQTTTSPFQDYLSVFTNEKTRQDTLEGTGDYNETLRTVCKLMGNSLYGRQLMKIQTDEYRPITSLADDAFDNEKSTIISSNGMFISKTKAEEKTYGCLQYGVFILAYSRDTLQKYMDICGRETIIATETDSFYLSHKGYEKLLKSNVIGKKLGQLKLEFNNCKLGYFTGKKQYYLQNPDDELLEEKDITNPKTQKVGDPAHKMRCKGVSAYLLKRELYESLIENKTYTVHDMIQFKRQLLTSSYTGVQVGKTSKTLKTTLEYKTYQHKIISETV